MLRVILMNAMITKYGEFVHGKLALLLNSRIRWTQIASMIEIIDLNDRSPPSDKAFLKEARSKAAEEKAQ